MPKWAEFAIVILNEQLTLWGMNKMATVKKTTVYITYFWAYVLHHLRWFHEPVWAVKLDAFQTKGVAVIVKKYFGNPYLI